MREMVRKSAPACSTLGSEIPATTADRIKASSLSVPRCCFETTKPATGGATIIVHETRGENAIVVVPGACFRMTGEDVDRAASLIGQSSIFVTQLELPLAVVEHGLALAHKMRVATILN